MRHFTKMGAENRNCPVEMCISLIGGKYRTMILWKLMECGTLRFSQLQRFVPKATPKMLSQQLRELVKSGLISRAVYPEVPPRVEYSLTPLGTRIRPLLLAMYDYGSEYFKEKGVDVCCGMEMLTGDPDPEDAASESGCREECGAGSCAGCDACGEDARRAGCGCGADAEPCGDLDCDRDGRCDCDCDRDGRCDEDCDEDCAEECAERRGVGTGCGCATGRESDCDAAVRRV